MSLGKNLAGSNPAPSLTDRVTPGKADSATSQGCGGTETPRSHRVPGAQEPPPPPPGKGRPQRRTAQSLLPFLSQPDGLRLSPRSPRYGR